MARIAGAVVALLAIFHGVSWASPDDLSRRLASVDFRAVADQKIRSRDAVAWFFRERQYSPAWTYGERSDLRDLRAAIGEAASHGLVPDDYHATALSRAMAAKNDLAVEILATDAYLTYGVHLLRGRLNPVSIEPDWTASRRSRDVIRSLSDALAKQRVRESLDALAPSVGPYRILRSALSRIEQSTAPDDFPIPAGPVLKIGMRSERVVTLRRRLASMGLLEQSASGEVDLFDPATEAAVAAVQRKFGLEADGVLGPLTLRELNRSGADHAAQIRANLERWRWLAEDLGRRHIRVNIPEFRLETWENENRLAVHDVIVGRAYRKTPVFSSEMTHVILNPWWETPRSIARLDKLPDFKSDPDMVRRLGFDVFGSDGTRLDPVAIDWSKYSATKFPFRLRQRPGPLNALGQVKLMFPNRHDVYLHDTPTQELFGRGRRDFSSGCIRVKNALGLTEWLLAETPGWNRERIDAAIASGRETRVNLAKKVAVHILYMTVVALPDGTARFLADLYDRDARLIAALEKAP